MKVKAIIIVFIFLLLLTLIMKMNNKNIEKFVAENEKLLDCKLASGVYKISDDKFKCCDPKFAKTPLCLNETVINNTVDPLTGKTNEEKKMYLDLLIASLQTQLKALTGIEREKAALYITEETNRVGKEGEVTKQGELIDSKKTEKQRLVLKKSRLEDTKSVFDKYTKTVELDNKVTLIDGLEDSIKNKIQSAIQHVVTQIGDLTKSYIYVIHLLFTIRESKRYDINLNSEYDVREKAQDIKQFERDIYKLFVTVNEIQHLYQLRINDQTDPRGVLETFVDDVTADVTEETPSINDLVNVTANTVNYKFENPDINITLANGSSNSLDWNVDQSKYVYVQNDENRDKTKIDALSSHIFSGFTHSDCDYETVDQNNICTFNFVETYTDPTETNNIPVYLDSDPAKITAYAFLFQNDDIPDSQMIMTFPCLSSLEYIIRQVYECNKTNNICSDLYDAMKNPSQTNTTYLNGLGSLIQEAILYKIFPI